MVCAATTADLEDGKLEELLDDFVITAQEVSNHTIAHTVHLPHILMVSNRTAIKT